MDLKLYTAELGVYLAFIERILLSYLILKYTDGITDITYINNIRHTELYVLLSFFISHSTCPAHASIYYHPPPPKKSPYHWVFHYWKRLLVSSRICFFLHRKGLYNRGLSFNSISAVGSNGAIIHYSPSNLTNKQITTSEMYLLDSGGQYLWVIVQQIYLD